MVNLNISSSTVTLTFTLGVSKQTFRMTLLLVKEKKCAESFLKSFPRQFCHLEMLWIWLGFNPLPITTFDSPRGKSLLKTLWEKEEMLVTSISSFSHNVFYSYQRRIAPSKPPLNCLM